LVGEKGRYRPQQSPFTSAVDEVKNNSISALLRDVDEKKVNRLGAPTQRLAGIAFDDLDPIDQARLGKNSGGSAIRSSSYHGQRPCRR